MPPEETSAHQADHEDPPAANASSPTIAPSPLETVHTTTARRIQVDPAGGEPLVSRGGP